MTLQEMKLESIERFKELWIKDVTENKRLMRKDLNKLSSLFDSRFKHAMIHLENSHKTTETDMNLFEFIDTVYRECVIIIENGVLLSSKDEDASPAVAIEAGLKAERKIVKKQSNFNLTEGDKALGARQNVIQNMVKLVMNIYFGVQNNKYSKFFNKALGGSITCRGRYLITLNAIVCEMFAGVYRFRNVGALIHMISEIRKETYSPLSMSVMAETNVSQEDLVEHLTKGTHNQKFIDLITKIVSDLDPLMVKKVYFKNNMYAILNSNYFVNFMKTFVVRLNDNYSEMKGRIGDLDENKRIITLSQAIYSDAYAYPKNCKDIFSDMEILIKELSFGYYWYDGDYVEESEKRTRSHLETLDDMDRYVIALIDTDSNMILVDEPSDKIIPFLKETNIEPEHKDHYDDIMSISITTFILATYASMCINRYKYFTQMPEKNHFHVFNKNEFYFSDLFISSSRKNYIARITVKEGMVYDKPEFEIKGLAIKKSGNNENMREAAADLIEMIFSNTKQDTLLQRVYTGMEKERILIQESLSDDRGLDYFAALKLADDLDNMEDGEHRVKAINAWNSIFPDDMIIPPANFYTVPLELNAKKLMDVYPKEYRILTVNMYKKLVSKNLSDCILRLVVSIPALLEDKGFHTRDSLKGFAPKVIQEETALITEIETIDKMILNDEFLLMKLEEIRKKAIEIRKRYEVELFNIYKTFKYPAAVYKFSLTDIKNNDYKLLLKINNMKVYTAIFQNKNDTLDKFYGKIAMPITATEVPTFIRTFVDVNTFKTLFDSLLAPIMSETGMIFVRTSSDKRLGTNIKNYF